MYTYIFFYRLAAENIVVNEFGEKTPSLYTPTNPLSKAAALAILFRKFCVNNGYVAPQPPLPQVINKDSIIPKLIYYLPPCSCFVLHCEAAFD